MRLFVYPAAKAQRSIAVFTCEKVAKTKATIPANVSLESIRPGMVCCPGEGRKVDRATTYLIAKVDHKKNELIFEGTTPVANTFEDTAVASEEGQNP